MTFGELIAFLSVNYHSLLNLPLPCTRPGWSRSLYWWSRRLYWYFLDTLPSIGDTDTDGLESQNNPKCAKKCLKIKIAQDLTKYVLAH